MGMRMAELTKERELETQSQNFWNLVDRFRQPLYAFIKKSLNYSEDAEDIYQETLLRAYRYFSSYRRDYPFRGWLYSIAHNELKKQYRQYNGKSSELPPEFIEDLARQDPDPLLVEEARRLHRLAMELKPAWREVFFLYYQDGFTVAEVARITGRSAGHVKFILHGCRKRVRAGLGGE